jgi:hypothetical protein
MARILSVYCGTPYTILYKTPLLLFERLDAELYMLCWIYCVYDDVYKKTVFVFVEKLRDEPPLICGHRYLAIAPI